MLKMYSRGCSQKNLYFKGKKEFNQALRLWIFCWIAMVPEGRNAWASLSFLKACICGVFQAGKRLLSSSPKALICKADLKCKQGKCISTGVWPVLLNLPRESRILYQRQSFTKTLNTAFWSRRCLSLQESVLREQI